MTILAQKKLDDREELAKLLKTRGEGKMKDVLDRARAYLSSTVSPILIIGESGSGKEFVAKAIMKVNEEKGILFSINCAAFSDDLLGSELFGHKIGAFTGANKERPGLMKAASNDENAGGIFLDEIDKSSRAFQNNLLRFLRDGTIRPVGSDKIESIKDLKVIFATSLSLEELTSQQERVDEDRNDSRSVELSVDFCNRIISHCIEQPPLRERREDIPLIVSHFIKKYADRHGKKISCIDGRSLFYIMNYSWPKNFAELESYLENGVVFAKDHCILIENCEKSYGSSAPSKLLFEEELEVYGEYVHAYLGIYAENPIGEGGFLAPDNWTFYSGDFDIINLDRIFENARVLSNIEYLRNDPNQKSEYDFEKVDKYFALKRTKKPQKAIYESLGFKSTRPFNTWLRKMHLDS